MNHRLRLVMLVLLAAATVGCESDGDVGPATQTTQDEESFALPFGMVEPPGVEPIGRPASVEQVQVVLDGVPVMGRSFKAAYWVTADDPASVVRTWVKQLDHLALDRVLLERGKGRGNPWIEVNHYPAESAPVAARSDWVTMQLWATDDAPILLIDIARVETVTNDPDVTDDLGGLSDPSAVLSVYKRTAGDDLFSQDGQVVHLPAGTRALIPTIPDGLGGSYSMLAAEDADAAIASLLSEARGLSDYEEVREPVTTDADGIRVVQASFVIPAGGWSFEVLSVQAPGDAYATLYVTSRAG